MEMLEFTGFLKARGIRLDMWLYLDGSCRLFSRLASTLVLTSQMWMVMDFHLCGYSVYMDGRDYALREAVSRICQMELYVALSCFL